MSDKNALGKTRFLSTKNREREQLVLGGEGRARRKSENVVTDRWGEGGLMQGGKRIGRRIRDRISHEGGKKKKIKKKKFGCRLQTFVAGGNATSG